MSAFPRRSATIVAIDAAGYSRQSEIDEATAVREIAALGERILAVAASRKGRVFNTAGDGFMLEFASASLAVAAAEEVQAVDRVPLRIGIHSGEVHETPTRDLLGKGVNIAARLMQLAQPGSIVVSANVKDALGADVVSRLSPGGVARLDKMSERIETYVIGSPWKRPAAIPVRWAIAGAAALTLLVVGYFLVQPLLRSGQQAVSVLEFRVLDPDLQNFAAGLSDRLVGAMSTHDLQVTHSSAVGDADRVAAALVSGAAFALDGAVRTEGDDVLVSARLIDRRGNLAIWSSEYRRAAAEQHYLQEQIAADVTHVLRCALLGVGRRAEEIDAATLSVFLRACDLSDQLFTSPEQLIIALRQVTERAPRFSRGWSRLALVAAQMSRMNIGPEDARAAAMEAEAAIAQARRLDRRNGEAYLAEALLAPAGDFGAREARIVRALAVEPDLAAAHMAHAHWFLELGRSREALGAARRGVALDPLNPDYWAELAPILSANGFQRDNDELRTRMYRVWPQSGPAWYNRFLNSAFNSDPNDALRMLDDVGAGPAFFHAEAVRRWRAFLQARRAGDAMQTRAAAAGMRTLIPGKESRLSVAAVLSMVGDIDAAIDVVSGAFSHGYAPSAIFLPPYANMRRDRRFIELMKDTGLIQFWRESGRWPDFCAAPDLTYNCQEEAARVLPP
ncbi:MAG TPA: adenylate/guanylate cyclase domain-containing protein [Terricaulis sp.]|nr:adenylate/guanylate cyclase domain-containing protein [Terricaulis sp.]